MKTVKEVSRLTGLSVRTLQYYDNIGLLVPSRRTRAGYRMYTDGDIERLSQIMFFRELEFPLKDIKRIIGSPSFDRQKALRQHIELLKLRREHIDGLISLAEKIQKEGNDAMNYEKFDRKRIEEYAEKAKKEWGDTEAYREYEEKSSERTAETEYGLSQGLMDILRQFGEIKGSDPGSEKAQGLVKDLQEYITLNWYTCTREILSGLGRMYRAGGEFTENIDSAGGEGTAVFARKAIEIYCR